MANSLIQGVRETAQVRLAQNDYAHQFDHAERVVALTDAIGPYEGGDPTILTVSGYVHDWCAKQGREQHVSEPAMNEIRRDLESLECPAWVINPVIDVVRHHEDYDFHGRLPLSKDCLILQDADRLDALGAIGIARCFYTSAVWGCPLGTLDDMHPPAEKYHIGQLTPALQHFYSKLLYLKDSMNTETARKMAEERHHFMENFLDRFKQEWRGEI